MKHKSQQDSICPVARSLDVVGEWWSLLIIRDAMVGVKRFSEFQRRLGMAKNILTVRLKRLVAEDVLRLVPASDGSAYSEYELTEKGEALLPTLIALRQWGERFMFRAGEEHSVIVDKKNRRPPAILQVQSTEGKPLGVDDLDLVMVRKSSRGKKRRSQKKTV